MKPEILAGVAACLFLLHSPATGNPALEAKVRELEAKLQTAEAELRRLKAPKTHEVSCERADIERRRPSFGPGAFEDVARMLEQLSGRPVDPVYDRRMLGVDEARPIAFMVRPGCSFLGGDRITEVNGVPIGDVGRVRAVLSQRDRWSFKVDDRQSTDAQIDVISDRNAFDLSRALGVAQSEAKVVPYSSGSEERGFLVWSVTPGGYFASAGLQPKDVLVSVNRIPLSHAKAEAIIGHEWKSKGRLAIEVLRDGRPFFLRTIAAGASSR